MNDDFYCSKCSKKMVLIPKFDGSVYDTDIYICPDLHEKRVLKRENISK